jgi:para-nitrobenzyl esterase
LATSAGFIVLGAGCGRPGAEPVVETAHGRVRGALTDGVYAFKGIPYGASTAGANRFMPPQPPTPWSDVRDCLAWGPLAPQRGASGAGGQSAAWFRDYFGAEPDMPSEQSEDCLTLNVFTTSLGASEKRPVMVWIHGGGYSSGSGAGSRTNGAHIAQRQNVVAVSVSHRLGVMGYCDLSAYGEQYALSGVAGQLDLIAALEWVRDNIEAFGGDPTKVMIHGESGGGSKVSTLLAMPPSQGLYHAAICQSGVATNLPGQSLTQATSADLLRQLQLDGGQISRLHDMPFEQVVAASLQMDASPAPASGPRRGFVPSVGNAALPLPPPDAVAQGSGAVPLIVGCTKHEAGFSLATAGVDPTTLTDADVLQRAAPLGPNAAQIIAAYKANHPDYSPGDILIRALSDGARMNSIKFAEAHVRGGAPTRMYLFAWESPLLPNIGSGHSIDCAFYLDNLDTVAIAAGNPAAQTLATQCSTAWANVAKTGVPSAEGLPAWPVYSLENRETMILSESPAIENDPMKEDRLMRARLSPA